MPVWGVVLTGLGALGVGYTWGAWKATGRELNAILWADKEQRRGDEIEVQNAQLRADLAQWQNERLGL